MRDSRKAKGYAQQRDGKWWARVVYFNSRGERRERRQLVDVPLTPAGKRMTQAKIEAYVQAEAQQLAASIDADAGNSLDHQGTTFAQLADFYAKHYMREVEYDANDNKLDKDTMMRPKTRRTAVILKKEGGRDIIVGGRLKVLLDYFGPQRLQTIDADDIKAFKLKRYKTPTEQRRCWRCKGTGEARKPGRRPANAILPPCGACSGSGKVGGAQRSWATVNRELTLLCAMLNVAEAREWIPRNPFNRSTRGRGKKDSGSLIESEADNARERVLSFAEEERVLSAIDVDTIEGRRMHTIVVCLLDSGMRLGEFVHLDWPQVDFAAGHIDLWKRTTKTLSARRVPLTPRMREALAAWREHFAPQSRYCKLCQGEHAHILGNCENIGRAWRKVRAAAGVDDVRIHDFRHTAATRLAHGQVPGPLLARILGHTAPRNAEERTLKMTTRYVGTTSTTTSMVVAAIEAAREAERAETVN